MIEVYLMHEKERNAQGIPALPLNPEQTVGLCELLQNPPAGKEEFLMNLYTERVSPGVDPAAEVKAAFLAELVAGAKSSPLIDKIKAVQATLDVGLENDEAFSIDLVVQHCVAGRTLLRDAATAGILQLTRQPDPPLRENDNVPPRFSHPGVSKYHDRKSH